MKRVLGQEGYCLSGNNSTRAIVTLACFVCLTSFQTTYAQSFITTDIHTEENSSTIDLNKSNDLNQPKPKESASLSIFGDSEYGSSFAGSGEIWVNKWGLSTELLENESSNAFGLPAESEYFNLDIKRRFGSNDKSNFELGLGWQELNIDSQLDASGPRVSLGGNLKVLKSFRVYGSTSYFPDLDDSINDDVSAYEFEAGLLYTPLPSLSLKAGYRVFNLDLEDPEIESLGSNSGFLLGTDWSW